jgi:hypothetical protein
MSDLGTDDFISLDFLNGRKVKTAKTGFCPRAETENSEF